MKSLLFLLLLVPGYANASNNIVVVFDDSGSMAETMSKVPETKMDVAKRSLNNVMKKVPAGSRVGILALNAGWIYPIQPIKTDTVNKAVNNIQANGGTPLGAALKASADELLKLRQKEHYGEYRLLVISDGEAGDSDVLEENLSDVLSRGITVDVIGLDMASGHSLSNKVNRYRSADDPKALSSAIYELIQAETSTQDAESFSEVAAFSNDNAVAILNTLSENPNHLIGEEPPVQDQSNIQNPTAVASAENGTSIGCVLLYILGGTIAVVVVIAFIGMLLN